MVFGWFRSNPATLRAKAEKALEARDFAKAIRLLEDALGRAGQEPEEVRSAISARLDEASDHLAEAQLEEARALFEDEEFISAEEFAELALARARSPARRAGAEALIQEIVVYI